VLYSKHLLVSFQSSPVHRFRLFVRALPRHHRPKLADM
jgi:hypothetical protein